MRFERDVDDFDRELREQAADLECRCDGRGCERCDDGDDRPRDQPCPS